MEGLRPAWLDGLRPPGLQPLRLPTPFALARSPEPEKLEPAISVHEGIRAAIESGADGIRTVSAPDSRSGMRPFVVLESLEGRLMTRLPPVPMPLETVPLDGGVGYSVVSGRTDVLRVLVLASRRCIQTGVLTLGWCADGTMRCMFATERAFAWWSVRRVHGGAYDAVYVCCLACVCCNKRFTH